VKSLFKSLISNLKLRLKRRKKEMIRKTKATTTVLISLLCISMFAMYTPKAAATGETIIGSLSIDDSQFLRCYDWSYEQSCYGYPSEEKYDVAYLTAELPAWQGEFYDGEIVQARLHKILEIDGEVVANGLEIVIPAEGPYPTMYIPIGRQGGAIWVDDQTFFYDQWNGNTLYFQYDLTWSGLTYGYNQWPNYWSTQSFTDAVNGHVWNGHTYRISFAIEWFHVTPGYPVSYVKIGATDDLPDSYYRHSFNVGTSHSDNGWESWKFLIPDDEIHFACSTQWTETYGSASITNPYEAQYRTPDSNYATFLASSAGSLARASYWIGGPCSGTVYVYGDSMNSPFSRFLVYVSSDNYNWRLSREQLVYNQGDRWIDCGTPSGTYQFVLVIAYNSGSTSYMKVNCINCGGHY
jgi:hypothetical protein